MVTIGRRSVRYPAGEGAARIGVEERAAGFVVVAIVQLDLSRPLRDRRTAERAALARLRGHLSGL